MRVGLVGGDVDRQLVEQVEELGDGSFVDGLSSLDDGQDVRDLVRPQRRHEGVLLDEQIEGAPLVATGARPVGSQVWRARMRPWRRSGIDGCCCQPLLRKSRTGHPAVVSRISGSPV